MKLHLPLKAEYFDAVRNGDKTEEYRLVSAYWTKRLHGREGAPRTFSEIVLTWGYPPAGDASRRIILPWRGFTRKTITHPHFGPNPVEVYAIEVRP